MHLTVVILAAGQGTRMRSDLPKVLHPVGGRPMLARVVDAARSLNPQRIGIVHGHGGDQVRARFHDSPLEWVAQERQLGTAHAVAQALPLARPDDLLLVLYGDVPLILPSTLERLVTAMDEADLALLTVHLDDPKGYGRIVRDDRGQVLRIVEEKDASPVEREIREVNTGILAARAADLSRWIGQIGNDNAQGEFYLTDAIELAVADGRQVQAVVARDAREVMGVNDKRQLAEVERAWQRRQAEALMRDGVTLLDPARFDLRGTLHAGRDVVIDIDVIIEGEVTLGDGVRIGAHTILRDCTIGAGSDIRPHSIVEQAEIGERCLIGPFARIRPDTALADEVHVGNFVELKKARVAAASKINHLSYVGDAEVGARVNIGAGTITCNYDGANKHLTTIGDDAFIGSDTSLVAPVTVGAGATIGAGSVVTRDAPPGELTVTRAKQQTIPGWKRPVKQPKP